MLDSLASSLFPLARLHLSIAVCLVQFLPPFLHFASPQEFLSWVGCSLCLQLQATVKAVCLPQRRRVKYIKHLLLTVKRPGYASGNAYWQSPPWGSGRVRVWKLRNATNMFVLHRAWQLTTCSSVRNQTLGWVKGGGCWTRVNKLRVAEGKRRT